MAGITLTLIADGQPLDARAHALQLIATGKSLLAEQGKLPSGLWLAIDAALALAVAELPAEPWTARGPS